MSLKAFHVFFITVATLVTAGFALWAVRQAVVLGGTEAFPAAVALAAVAMLTTVALPVYGAWFLKKTKEVSFL